MAATDPIATLAEISRLLKAGEIQAADDLATATHVSLTAAAVAAGEASAPPPPPRDPSAVVYDLLLAFSSKLGHPADVLKLLEELAAVSAIAGS